MNLYILNKNFETVYVLDSYISFIWTDRYSSPGDFEIYTFPSSEILQNILIDYYIWNKDSDRMMIVETIEIESTTENGVKLKITGRSLESILDRRIVWQQTIISSKIQTGIHNLINDSIISPSDSNRQISNFIFQETDDEYIDSIVVDNEYTGDNLLEIIQDLCTSNGIGFKITLDDNHNFVFQLYVGRNLTYNQTTIPYVVFSPNFDNLISSNYIESSVTLKTVTLVAGSGEGLSRITETVDPEGETGLYRRELYTDARDIDQISPISEYRKCLQERGTEKLSENKKTISFEADVDPNQPFKYGIDFFIGDDVQIVNDYGIQGTARIIEFIISDDDSNGYKTYPTFQIIEDDSTEEESES